MPVKTTVKKTMRTKSPKTKNSKIVKRPVKKSSKKVTWDDIQEGFKEIEKVQKEAWAAIRETQQAHKETEKAIQETQQAHKETEKAIQETQQAHKETEKAIKETQINIGGLNRTLGSIVEHILTPALPQKFKKLGYSFNRISMYKFSEGVWAQIDGMLENGELAIAVEVKATLRNADIDNHLVRMEKIKKFADEHGDKRQFMGAMASTITDDSNRNYALKKGLFVIEPSGEDVRVFKPEGEPRVW
ncbi:hypothetical protein [Treponema sp. R80B11-R83G3]